MKDILGEIQTLAGCAKAAFLNDRDPMRADHVIEPLDRIFELCVSERSKKRVPKRTNQEAGQ